MLPGKSASSVYRWRPMQSSVNPADSVSNLRVSEVKNPFYFRNNQRISDSTMLISRQVTIGKWKLKLSRV